MAFNHLILPADGLILAVIAGYGRSLFVAYPSWDHQRPDPELYEERIMKVEVTPQAHAFIRNHGGEVTLVVLSVGG